MTMHTLHLQRPAPIAFVLADGRTIIAPPVTRGQVRAAIALDPAEGITLSAVEMALQIERQLAALMGPTVTLRTGDDAAPVESAVPAAALLDTLTPDEQRNLLAGLLALGFGQDPAQAVAAQEVLKKKALLAALLVSSDSTTTPPPSPSI